MIYTHVLNCGGLAVENPLDQRGCGGVFAGPWC
jgi:hypothetical protein